MRYIYIATLYFLPLLFSCSKPKSRETPITVDTSLIIIEKISAINNPTGLKIGFYEGNDRPDLTLEYFGKRPVCRIGFKSWDNIERTEPGIYNWGGVFDDLKFMHRYGQDVLCAVNISFSSQIIQRKSSIPSFYPERITDSVTRKAARKFLFDFVQKILTEVGSVYLTIDYEIVSNYKLFERTDSAVSRANEWSKWYIEAATVAKQAATVIGMRDKLVLQPIVNGDVLSPDNPVSDGPLKNKWLVDVVSASDAFALDTYQTNPLIADNSDPQYTFDIIKFWIDNYAADKPVMIAENGYNCVSEYIPSITRAQRKYKTTGNINEQANFYKRLFEKLDAACKQDGIFKNKIRAYNIWSACDNSKKPLEDEERYFGLIGLQSDNVTHFTRPAVSVVKSGIDMMENNVFHSPVKMYQRIDAKGGLNAAGVLLKYNSGTQYDFIRYKHTKLPALSQYILHIELANTGSILCNVNGKWLFKNNALVFDIDVTSWSKAGVENKIDLYCTGDVFPLSQTVKNISINNF